MFIAIATIALLVATFTGFILMVNAIMEISLVKTARDLSTLSETVHKLLRAYRIEEVMDFCRKYPDKFVYSQSAQLIELGGNREMLNHELAQLEKVCADLWPNAMRRFWLTIIQLGMLSFFICMSIAVFARTEAYWPLMIIGVIANVAIFCCGIFLILDVFWLEKKEYLEVIPYFKRLTQALIFYEIPPTEKTEE